MLARRKVQRKFTSESKGGVLYLPESGNDYAVDRSTTTLLRSGATYHRAVVT